MSPISVSKYDPHRATNPSTADPSQSKTATTQPMAEKDLESIGRHCEFAFCRQLDFLPFRCESCRGTFCLEHRTESAHKCPKEGEWARRAEAQRQQQKENTASLSEKPNIYNTNQCAHLTCKTLINTLKDPGVTCPDCRRQFCLKHRLREEHECRPARQRQGPQSGGNESLKAMFSRMRTWGKDKSTIENLIPKSKPKANSSAARIAEVNAMKKSAKGDASIPSDRRIYLHVAGASDTPKADAPHGDFFYDSRWKVGRVLDDAARKLGVENVNNRGGGEETRLRIFHVETGEFLEFSDAIGDKVRSGHTIVLLRGAGVALGKG